MEVKDCSRSKAFDMPALTASSAVHVCWYRNRRARRICAASRSVGVGPCCLVARKSPKLLAGVVAGGGADGVDTTAAMASVTAATGAGAASVSGVVALGGGGRVALVVSLRTGAETSKSSS